jgi:hypothetical protein
MSNIKLFESTEIRSVWNEDEESWYFSIVDVIALQGGTISGNARKAIEA